MSNREVVVKNNHTHIRTHTHTDRNTHERCKKIERWKRWRGWRGERKREKKRLLLRTFKGNK